MPGTSKYKSNLAFGLFVTLAVAVAVGVVLLLNGDVGENDSPAPQAEAPPRTEAAPQPRLACQFEGMAGEVRIVFDPVGGSCASARRAYAAFMEMARRGAVDGYEPARVAGWSCREYPFSEYPLLVGCAQSGRRFEVLGLAPSAHEGG